ncbi:MAG: glycosyltransferase [Nakamurella sp.]
MSTVTLPDLRPTGISSDAVLGRPHRRRAQAVIIANVLATLWYFGWLLKPERVGNPSLYGLLLAAEMFNLLQAAGFWWTLWHDGRPAGRRQRRIAAKVVDPAAAQQIGTGGREVDVDVFVPRYNEAVEVVEPVLRAARLLHGARVRVHLLDDGDSDEMRLLASRLDVNYITRPQHTGAKAGNINHALGVTDADYLVILDCDHVPHPDLLVRTLPDLLDEGVAFVQTPQYYANADRNATAAASWSQQALFFGCIGRGKSGIGSMFCCGTNVVFRRSALQDVGGFPENSVTEDFELSVILQERGWRTAYVPEVLVQGLGPEDMASYVSQQMRWASGCLSGMSRSMRSELPIGLKVQYLLSGMYFLTGWTVLIYLSLPVTRILTGEQPIASSTASDFLMHFAPYFILSLMTVSVAGGGIFSFRALSLATASYWVHIAATIKALSRRPGRFVVTPKNGSGSWQPAAVWPGLLTCGVLVAVSVYGLIRSRDASMLNNVAFAMLHLTVLVTGMTTALRPTRIAALAMRDLPAGDARWQSGTGMPADGVVITRLVTAP